jgi:hypothetical protein
MFGPLKELYAEKDLPVTVELEMRCILAFEHNR